MTLDEFKDKKTRIKCSGGEAYGARINYISEKLHENHQQMRDLYHTYVCEHFPYKVGDVLEYTFVNRDGDKVTRIITVKEISTYMCDFSNIIITYYYHEYKNNLTNNRTGRIDLVRIDGTGKNATLKKIG